MVSLETAPDVICTRRWNGAEVLVNLVLESLLSRKPIVTLGRSRDSLRAIARIECRLHIVGVYRASWLVVSKPLAFAKRKQRL